MSHILIPSRRIWTRQPQRAAGIKWNDPITRDLVIVENHSNPRFSAFGSLTKKAGLSHRGAGGVANQFVSASSQYLKQSNTRLTNYPLTFLSVFQRASRPFDGVLISIGAGTNRHVLYVNNDNIACFSGAGATNAQAASTNSNLGSTAPGDVRCAVGVVSAANSRAVYLDGVLVGTNATTISTGVSDTAVIGCYWNNDAPSVYFNGDIYLSLAWARALSPAEIRSISQNPWRIFRRRRGNVIFVDFGARAGSTLNAAGTAQAAGLAQLAAQIGLAGIGVAVAGGQAPPAVAIPLAAAGLAVAGGQAAPKATVTLSAAGLAAAAGQAGLSASVLAQAAAAAQAAGNATLSAQLNALASGAAQAAGNASLTGGAPGALAAAGQATAQGNAVLTVSVQLQAAGAAQSGGVAAGSAQAPGALSAAGQAAAGGFAQWSALINLTAAGFVQAMGQGSLAITVPLSAQGAATAQGLALASLGGTLQPRRLVAEAPRRIRRLATGAQRLITLQHGARHV